MLNNNDFDNAIGISELIAHIKKELLSTQYEKPALFGIKEIEAEISFTVIRDMNGKVNLHIVESGVKKSLEAVQVVRIKMDPLISIEEMKKSLSDEDQRIVSNASIRSSHLDE